ncbi:MAG TPA: VWA domain-containing protein, partial [Pyrinomonadaceae bacterium]|nr:VWA domain-containing protein [Pyrinomonadaceae bacterium]
MKNREVDVKLAARVRTLPALAVAAFALLALFLPASRAEDARQTGSDARPRRVQTAPTPTPKPVTTTPPAGTTARPAPTPEPKGPIGGPKLQTGPTTKSDEKSAEEEAHEVDENDIERVEVNLINLQVRVVDRNNRPVGDVKKEEFRVFENGTPQTIEFVSKEEVPISYGLVVDNSGSLRSQIAQVIEAGKTIVNSNRPGDETFVVRFISSDEIKVMQDFTADKGAVGDALEDMYVEGGQTAIIDAVVLSAEHAAEHKTGNQLDDKRRRALILVTDGEDRNSFYKQEQLFENLKEQDVQIYVIGFVNELDKEGGFISKSKRQKAVDLLDRLAKETGGRAFYPNSLSELPRIADEITKDMRTQYVVSYTPTTKARPGEFRAVRVSVADSPGRDKRIAVTRPGYTAKGDGGSPNNVPSTAAPG